MRNDNNNALDAFRILATVQVFSGHVISHFLPPPRTGIIWNSVYFVRGVPILFVLCGFLAAKSLENCNAERWLIGRAVRLLPAYWVCVAVNTAVIAILYPVRPSLKEGVIYVLTQFSGMNFYTGDWLRGYGVGAPNGVLWTIAVQAQFFIIAPLLHRFLRRAALKFDCICVFALAFLSVACNWLDGRIPETLFKLLGVTVVPYLYFLLFGMALYYHRDLLVSKAEAYRRRLLAAYVIWKLCEIFFRFPHVFDGVLYNTITTLLLGCVIAAFGFRKTFRMKTDYTYGFYLYHMVFINIAVQWNLNTFLPPLQGILHVGAVILAALAAAWLSNAFVQTPAARRRILSISRPDSEERREIDRQDGCGEPLDRLLQNRLDL